MKCSICFYAREKTEDADMVLNGQTVCVEHAPLVQGGDHSRAVSDAIKLER